MLSFAAARLGVGPGRPDAAGRGRRRVPDKRGTGGAGKSDDRKADDHEHGALAMPPASPPAPDGDGGKLHSTVREFIEKHPKENVDLWVIAVAEALTDCTTGLDKLTESDIIDGRNIALCKGLIRCDSHARPSWPTPRG